MRVVEADLLRVSQPLRHAFTTSSHRKTHLDHLLVRLVDESGAVGWGEIASPSDPFYCPETVETCWAIAERMLLPGVLGVEAATPADLAATWRRVRGNPFARAGVDMAAWTLASTLAGRPLAAMLGGTRASVVAGVSLGIEASIDDLLEQVERQVAAGYPRVKLKIAPGWDVDPVRAVRERHGDLDLHVDANGVYDPADDDALRALGELDAFGLTMIEQPFGPREWLAHARLAHLLTTPVCLDESVEELADLDTMIDLGAGSVLNIKVSRMGGLTAARAAHERARAAGVAVWCGGMHEFGVGRAANVALSSLPGFTLPSDVSSFDKYWERDIVTDPVVAEAGVVTVPTAPGPGFTVDEEFLAARTLARTTLRA